MPRRMAFMFSSTNSCLLGGTTFWMAASSDSRVAKPVAFHSAPSMMRLASLPMPFSWASLVAGM